VSVTVADLAEMLRRVEAARPVMVCHPDDEAVTREVASLLPLAARVFVNRNVPAGTVYGFPRGTP
jgi:hypothetical protein